LDVRLHVADCGVVSLHHRVVEPQEQRKRIPTTEDITVLEEEEPMDPEELRRRLEGALKHRLQTEEHPSGAGSWMELLTGD
jgi:hypothetical protein